MRRKRRRNSARKHAKGYKEYARLDGLRRHAAYLDGYDSDGVPLCVCTYPLLPTKDEKKLIKWNAS